MGKFLSIIITIIFFIIKILYWLLKAIVIILGDILIFFGLYIPGLYLLFGATLSRYLDFSMINPGTDRTLFFVGLGLCLVCAVIITIRNLIIKPFKTVFGNFKDKAKKEIVESRPKLKDSKLKKDKDKPRRGKDIPEEKPQDIQYPLVYKSKIYPEITVYEYEDRFELFRDSDDELGKKYVKTEFKNNFK